MSFCRALLLAAVAAGSLVAATAPDTAQLAAKVKAMRGRKEMSTPEYQRYRDQAVAWVDARVRRGVKPQAMNQELKAAGLMAREGADEFEDGQLGAFEEIAADQKGSVTVVSLPVHRAVYCKVDTTAIVYAGSQRLAALNGDPDHATNLQDVAFGADGLIASGWTMSNCTSAWNGKVIRVDRGGVNLLRRGLNARSDDGPDVAVELDGNHVSFRYNGSTGDADILAAPAIARYRIEGDRVVRESPFALTRLGAVYEWLHVPDSDAAGFSDPAAMKVRARVLKASDKHIFSVEKVGRCSAALWEVGVSYEEAGVDLVFRVAGSRAADLRIVSVTDGKPKCKPVDTSQGYGMLAEALP